MINTSKGLDIASCFPIRSVENDLIVSEAAEVTAAYRVELPEVFNVSGAEYETIHATWLKALKVLPKYSIVCKQDWFTKDRYSSPKTVREKGFLGESSDRYFEGRPYMAHTCYLFLTRTRKGRSRVRSINSMLLSGRIIPEDLDEKALDGFKEAVDQFERIMNDCSLVRLSRLTTDEIVGTTDEQGLLERHLTLTQRKKKEVMQDFVFDKGTLWIGDKEIVMFSIGNDRALPLEVSTDRRYEAFCTEASECNLSLASPLGVLFPYNHIYNQYIFIDDGNEILRRLEKEADWKHSLSGVGSANITNEAAVREYMGAAAEYQLLPVRAHCNIMAWGDREEVSGIKNEMSSAMSAIGCESIRQNTVDGPVLYWASIPGNAGEFPREETYLTFAENALCLFTEEGAYRDIPSGFGIRLTDRMSGRPVHVDMSEYWMEKGAINNRNKFVLGGSGSGKSFLMNHLLQEYYDQGAHILLVDIGDSYEGLCDLIRARDKGDGVYFTYTEKEPIAFNPFYTDDNVYDLEKKESLKTLILSLWKRDGADTGREESVAVSNAVTDYLEKVQGGGVAPSFNTFYEFVRDEFNATRGFEELMVREKVEAKDLFNVVNFLYVLAPYYKGGEYDYLLNSDKDLDLLDKRFIVFEIDKIRDNKVLFPVVTLVIMEAFINKMRRRRDQLKLLVLEEAWKAIAKEGMAEYVKYMYKTVRKYHGEVTVVSQEMDDIISSEIVKDSIIANSGCKILLSQESNMNKFDRIREILGLTEKNKDQVLSINKRFYPGRNKYKEVWIGWGNTYSSVYATEVSPEEFYAFCDQGNKSRVKRRTAEKGGDMEAAIRSLVAEDKERKRE